MLRIALFLLTNLAIVLIASITLSLLGFEGYLASNGVDLNLSSLLVFCFVFGMAGSVVSLLLSKTMAKMGTGTQIIESPRNADEQWLVATVAELAKDAGIGMPEVGIFQSQTSNAFATGWDRNNALVAVSTGLLSRFSRDEARAVMAHEIGHVANGDMITLALIQGVVNTFVMFFSRVIGHTIDRAVFKTERGHGPAFYITTFVAEIILGILASIIVFWFSRQREFRADQAGAQLAGAPAMIGALERLRAEQGTPSELPDSMVAFGIRTGGNTMMRLFMTHPPLEERIAALKAAA
ncbi:MAG TPA: protease HtpX [Gammaproteobacteria bacterium]|jgi:heat shock protein HtpX|nr:protease HtpX [Litorivicinus sp.]MDA8704768.1 protease HtpX [Litorivicinaceae bacterium]MDF1783832.1 protease HtpX [Litorivicinaceae bacterium]NBR74408.1 protease HtpX [Gammaproteobacteria bacterium]HAY55773.1 protease HtpX [Gammaproteobacteria bacterium]